MPHSFGLDALRVSALLFVLFAHGCAFWLPSYPNLLAFPAKILSFIGIEIFFVLSGFLISPALFRMVTRQDLMNFWKRRAVRTLPSYYLLLVLNFFVMGFLLGRPTGDASYFWFGQNAFAPMQVFFFPESWSLALEMWFYLLAPIVAWLLVRRTRTSALAATTLAVFLLVFFALLRWQLAAAGAAWDEGLRKVVLLRLDALVFGVLAGGYAITRPQHFRRLRLPALLLALVLLGGLWRWTWSNQTAPSVRFSSLSFSLCGLAAMFLLPFFASWRHASGALLGLWITQLSRWAFALYLTHVLVLLVALHYAGQWMTGSVWRLIALTLAWLIISFGFAAMLYRWVEQPLMQLAAPTTPTTPPQAT